MLLAMEEVEHGLNLVSNDGPGSVVELDRPCCPSPWVDGPWQLGGGQAGPGDLPAQWAVPRMKQLPLDILAQPVFSFDHFFPGPNEWALAHFDGPVPPTGPEGPAHLPAPAPNYRLGSRR